LLEIILIVHAVEFIVLVTILQEEEQAKRQSGKSQGKDQDANDARENIVLIGGNRSGTRNKPSTTETPAQGSADGRRAIPNVAIDGEIQNFKTSKFACGHIL
jgi:hypothetical protein